jgi:hypothetical protein
VVSLWIWQIQLQRHQQFERPGMHEWEIFFSVTNEREHSKYVYVYTQLGILFTPCSTVIPNHSADKLGDTRYTTLRKRAYMGLPHLWCFSSE